MESAEYQEIVLLHIPSDPLSSGVAPNSPNSAFDFASLAVAEIEIEPELASIVKPEFSFVFDTIGFKLQSKDFFGLAHTVSW